MSRKKELDNTKLTSSTSKEIVKYNNRLSELPLRNFNAADLDIFMTLCSVCKEKGVNDIEIPLSQLKNLSKYSKTNRMSQTEEERNAEKRNLQITPKSFIGALKQTNKKILGLNLEIDNNETPGIYVQFNLFKTFIIDEKKGLLTVKVNEDFAYILNDLTSDFTKFDLVEFVTLSSFYAKAAYRQFKRFRDTGKWFVSAEDFKSILCIPSSYAQSDIDGRVLSPIINELNPIFEGLSVEKQYAMKGLRGRPSVSGYTFTWKPNVKQKGTWQGISKNSVGFTCPYCNEPLVEKLINGSNAWCHPDNFIDNKKNGTKKCVRIFNSVEEIEKARESVSQSPDDLVVIDVESAEKINDIKKKLPNLFATDKGSVDATKPMNAEEIRKTYGKIEGIQELIDCCKIDFAEEDDERLERDLGRLQNFLIKNGCPENRAVEYSHKLI